MRNVLLLLLVLVISGCGVRTYTTKQNEADFDVVTGERREPDTGKRDKRKMFVIEIETGTKKPVKKSQPAEDYSSSESSYSRSTTSSYSSDTEDYSSTDDSSYASTETTYTEYKVQKNDTLQKISEKFYGTTRKWQMLFEENKDVLKSPDKVYPGLTLRVPNK